eukprot:11178734-Lingulodinium_polyedra.AAC.1
MSEKGETQADSKAWKGQLAALVVRMVGTTGEEERKAVAEEPCMGDSSTPAEGPIVGPSAG